MEAILTQLKIHFSTYAVSKSGTYASMKQFEASRKNMAMNAFNRTWNIHTNDFVDIEEEIEKVRHVSDLKVPFFYAALICKHIPISCDWKYSSNRYTHTTAPLSHSRDIKCSPKTPGNLVNIVSVFDRCRTQSKWFSRQQSFGCHASDAMSKLMSPKFPCFICFLLTKEK